jgi:hypothetical protein
MEPLATLGPPRAIIRVITTASCCLETDALVEKGTNPVCDVNERDRPQLGINFFFGGGSREAKFTFLQTFVMSNFNNYVE